MFKLKQKIKNLFWLFIGIVISLGLILKTTGFLKYFGYFSLIWLILGIFAILIISEKNQPNLPKPRTAPIGLINLNPIEKLT